MTIMLYLFKHVGLKKGIYERVGALKLNRDNRFGDSIDPSKSLMINFNIALCF